PASLPDPMLASVVSNGEQVTDPMTANSAQTTMAAVRLIVFRLRWADVTVPIVSSHGERRVRGRSVASRQGARHALRRTGGRVPVRAILAGAAADRHMH